jgi:hypothetical protein
MGKVAAGVTGCVGDGGCVVEVEGDVPVSVDVLSIVGLRSAGGVSVLNGMTVGPDSRGVGVNGFAIAVSSAIIVAAADV